MSSPEVPSELWVNLFVLSCASLALCCLYHAVKVGLAEWSFALERRDSRFARIRAAITHVLSFALFAFLFWLLESWAHFRTPYYVYSPVFPDLLPRLDFDALLTWDPETRHRDCAAALIEFMKRPGNARFTGIPFSVVLMEASITYAAMWTALKLRARLFTVPFIVGLFAFNIDLLLDPVVAASYDCSGQVQKAGLGFWHWYIFPSDGTPPYLGHWFGVPLFNYAAWWGAPAISVALFVLLQGIRGRYWRRLRGREPWPGAPTGSQIAWVLFAVVVAGGFIVFQFLVPGGFDGSADDWPIYTQWVVLGLAVLVTLGLLLGQRRSFDIGHRADRTLIWPLLGVIALSVSALCIEGYFLDFPALIFVATACTLLGLYVAWWPYGRSMLQFANYLIDLDRFVRLRYYGYSSTITLLGAFAVALQRDPPFIVLPRESFGPLAIAMVLVVAAAFHVFAYVTNDLLDLGIDETAPSRRQDPLVRRAIAPEIACSIAFFQLPLAALFMVLGASGWEAGAVIVVGGVLMSIYNYFGKRCPVPPLTDAIQALAWGSLVLFGALAARHLLLGNSQALQIEKWYLVGTVFVFASGFILLINGIHGGFRDLENDTRHSCRTTASWLGARLVGNEVISTRSILVYAFFVQTLMFAPALWFVFDDPLKLSLVSGVALRTAQAFLLVLFSLNSIMLFFVVRERQPRRAELLEAHMLLLLLPLPFTFAPFLEWSTAFLVILCFFGPFLSNSDLIRRLLQHTHPGNDGEVAAPPTYRRAA